MKIHTIKCLLCGDEVFSRCRHDMRWCSCGNCAIDGGTDYTKISAKYPLLVRDSSFHITYYTKDILYNDWKNQTNKLGIIKHNTDFDYSKIPQDYKNHKLDEKLGDAAAAGEVAKVKRLLLSGADAKDGHSYALRKAAQKGYTDIVKLLIPVSEPKDMHSLALRWAVENNHIECVKLLIPVSDPKAMKSEALCIAAFHGFTEIVKLLIPVSDVKTRNSEPLYNAIKHFHTDIVKLLLPVSDKKWIQKLSREIKALGVDVEKYLSETNENKAGAEKNNMKQTKTKPQTDTEYLSLNEHSIKALRNGETEKAFKRLLQAGAKKNNMKQTKTKPQTYTEYLRINEHLIKAIRNGETEKVKGLLQDDADPKYDDSLPIRTAAREGHADIVKLLIPISDVNDGGTYPVSYYPTALCLAINYGHKECIDLLLPVSDVKTNESTALVIAADVGDIDTLKRLIPISDPKANNSQALLRAVKNNHIECVKLLIPVSDINDIENYRTEIEELGIKIIPKPLFVLFEKCDANSKPRIYTKENIQLAKNKRLVKASSLGDTEEVKILLKWGADAKYKDSLALRRAAKSGYADIVKLLIPVSEPKANDSWVLRAAAYHGHNKCVKMLIPVSDPKARNSLALFWAVENKHKKCVELLLPVSAPADIDEIKPALEKLGIYYHNYFSLSAPNQPKETEMATKTKHTLHVTAVDSKKDSFLKKTDKKDKLYFSKNIIVKRPKNKQAGKILIFSHDDYGYDFEVIIPYKIGKQLYNIIKKIEAKRVK